MMVYMKGLLIAIGYVIAAMGITMFSFALARWTKLALIPSVVTLFISMPMLMMGGLRFYWGSYEDIPPVAWVCIGTMLFAGVLFGVGMLLNE
jgi:hypothetical protein